MKVLRLLGEVVVGFYSLYAMFMDFGFVTTALIMVAWIAAGIIGYFVTPSKAANWRWNQWTTRVLYFIGAIAIFNLDAPVVAWISIGLIVWDIFDPII
jgi:hypothetical protein